MSLISDRIEGIRYACSIASGVLHIEVPFVCSAQPVCSTCYGKTHRLGARILVPLRVNAPIHRLHGEVGVGIHVLAEVGEENVQIILLRVLPNEAGDADPVG